MLVHVSEGSYGEGVRMADYFITHVDVLFCAIDDLATHYMDTLKEELHYDREAHMLCKKITNFFALLSHTQGDGPRRIGITQDLLSLVTGLAQYLKVLIRLGLTGALKLVSKVVSSFILYCYLSSNPNTRKTQIGRTLRRSLNSSAS